MNIFCSRSLDYTNRVVGRGRLKSWIPFPSEAFWSTDLMAESRCLRCRHRNLTVSLSWLTGIPQFVHQYLSICSPVFLNLFTSIPQFVSPVSLKLFSYISQFVHRNHWICILIFWEKKEMNELKDTSKQIYEYWWTKWRYQWTNSGYRWTNLGVPLSKF